VAMAAVSALVLAAGEGTRMRSARPKPLHRLCGRPMVFWVLDALADLDVARTVVVVGHGAERVTKQVQEGADARLRVDFVEQARQRGTGDAVAVGLTAFPGEDVDDDSTVLVLPGDTPLLTPATIARLVEAHEARGAAATVLTAALDDATGYGRVIRGRDGRVARIVEHRDATEAEREIREVNTSIYCFRRSVLGPALRRVSPQNAQGEYYLTDVVGVLHGAGYPVQAVVLDDPAEASGVNDRLQLSEAEAVLRQRINAAWMRAGVTMLDPTQTFVEVGVQLGTDVTLYPGTILQGGTVIGDSCDIGPDTRLVDTVVGRGCVVEHAVAHHAEIGDGAHVGPYAVLEPGAVVEAGARTGPFYTATR
jgi:bifunctional UDP-N-acetylglucosamine pyrophosphorylase/glucosamine-1-phosphate N-acetyltransferase